MEAIIRIALMFFFIQFLVIITTMIVALLGAQPDDPAPGRELGREGLRRRFAAVVHLPIQVFRSVARRVRSPHSKHGMY